MILSGPKSWRMHRRDFLKSVSLVTLAGVAGLSAPMLSMAAETGDVAQFHAFSQFISGLKLDPILAARYLASLSGHDPKFLQSLEAAIAATGPFKEQGIDAMLRTLDPASDVHATIATVTSAWYLGVVGTGETAQLIAFHDALMFEPTRDYVFVPTYGGGPDSWVSEKHV